MQERPTILMLWAFTINQTQEGRVVAEGGEFGNGQGPDSNMFFCYMLILDSFHSSFLVLSYDKLTLHFIAPTILKSKGGAG
jgi:hypothetical protein